jgi:hypothetical protein
MECLAALAIIVLLVLVPLARMLFGKGPNNLRRLMRLDIAAFLVLTAGVALALAIARVEQSYGMACILVLVLPFALAFAWLGRYLLEDVAVGFGRRLKSRQDADLSFLTQPPTEDEVVAAELVEPDPAAPVVHTPPHEGPSN